MGKDAGGQSVAAEVLMDTLYVQRAAVAHMHELTKQPFSWIAGVYKRDHGLRKSEVSTPSGSTGPTLPWST